MKTTDNQGNELHIPNFEKYENGVIFCKCRNADCKNPSLKDGVGPISFFGLRKTGETKDGNDILYSQAQCSKCR
ncbi:MAG: hypothetical protein LBM93_00375 [Oscillospiraceae bacterium]|nr:hypothetical protein [Oscillospiraceae bacterium]